MIRPTKPVVASAPLLLLVLSLASAGCAKSKSNEATPAGSVASAAVATGSSIPASAARTKLCSDGAHKPGDHWKEACNPCRCAANGEVTCAQFPCGTTDAGLAGDAAP